MLKSLTLTATFFTALFTTFFTSVSYGADSVNHASQSVKHSAIGAKHLASGTVKVAASVVALPLLSAGASVDISATPSLKAGEALITFALSDADVKADDNQPLPIADEVIIAGPSPKMLLTSKENKQ